MLFLSFYNGYYDGFMINVCVTIVCACVFVTTGASQAYHTNLQCLIL